MGIQWRVADAKAAGIHPLAALGATTPSGTGTARSIGVDHSMSNAVGKMGQHIGRLATRNAQGQIEEGKIRRNILEQEYVGKRIENKGASFVSCNPTDRVYQSGTNHECLVMANHSIQARRMVDKTGAPNRF